MAHRGKLIKVYVDTAAAGGAGATWVLVAQQDDFSLKMDTKKVDAGTKDDDGNPNDTITGKSWSGSFNGKLKVDDTAWAYVKESYLDEEKIYIKVNWSAIGGTSEEGQVVIDSLEWKASKDGSVEYTCNFSGQGVMTTAVL